MSELRYCCIVEGFTETESDRARGSCPLQHVSVTGLIRDAVAQYTVVQSFANPLKNTPIEAAYSFPLYEGAAVIGFEAEVDGRKIVGNVREKAAAKENYDKAKKAGKVASLLEQETPDVFQACIGNIPPSKSVSIRITLISDLRQDAEENQVRFVVPTIIAPRYGYRESELEDSNVDTSTSKLVIDIGCEMSKAITSIQSPSHTIAVQLGTTSNDQTSLNPNRARVSLTTDALLDSDFVIIVQALGLDEPRALVELHPRDKTHAISLTFAPRFTVNPLRSSEFIFIVDRSGSMDGTRIKQAGAALELFLRSIPCEDHYFNVIGFGSNHQALFPKSVAYNEDSLKQATRYAQTLEADMGGTEIAGAVEEAFQRRRRDVPSQLFLLTDGEVWDVDTLCATIREAVDEGERSNAFVRVFSLGIGDAVSHDLVESVARAGGGYAQLVLEDERMEKKVLNMLKAALVPPVTNVGVQWLDEAWNSKESGTLMEGFVVVEADDPQTVTDPPTTEKEPINLYSTSPEPPSPPSPTLSPPPDVITPIQQAPFKIPILCRGARFTIYAILAPTVPVSTELVLRGSSPDGPVELRVKTHLVSDASQPMLHSSAARALVRDLEEGSSCIHALGNKSRTDTQQQTLERLGVHVEKEGKRFTTTLPLHSKHVTELTKKHILDIATRYSLSSKHTSWVAIDEATQQNLVHEGVESSFELDSYQPVPRFYAPRMNLAVLHSAPMYSAPTLELAMQYSTPLPDEEEEGDCGFDLVHDSAVAAPNYGAPASLTSSSLVSDSCELPGAESEAPSEEATETVADTDPHVRLQSILQHQSFDGSFPLSPKIAAFFSTTVEELTVRLEEVRKQSALTLSGSEWETVWATCLAVEFMRTQLPELQDEWELVVEKAEKRVRVLTRKQDLVAIKQAAALVAAGNGEQLRAEVVPAIQVSDVEDVTWIPKPAAVEVEKP